MSLVPLGLTYLFTYQDLFRLHLYTNQDLSTGTGRLMLCVQGGQVFKVGKKELAIIEIYPLETHPALLEQAPTPKEGTALSSPACENICFHIISYIKGNIRCKEFLQARHSPKIFRGNKFTLFQHKHHVTFFVQCLCFHLKEFQQTLCLRLCPTALLREHCNNIGLSTFGLCQDSSLNALNTFQFGGQDLLLRLRRTDTSGKVSS